MHETKVRRDKDGWSAITRVPLGDDKRVLRVRTAKSTTTGALTSSATVWSTGPTGLESHAMGMGTDFGDFSQYVIKAQISRVTETVVSKQHAAAMAKLPQVLEAIERHYQAQAARQASEASQAAAMASTPSLTPAHA